MHLPLCRHCLHLVAVAFRTALVLASLAKQTKPTRVLMLPYTLSHTCLLHGFSGEEAAASPGWPRRGRAAGVLDLYGWVHPCEQFQMLWMVEGAEGSEWFRVVWVLCCRVQDGPAAVWFTVAMMVRELKLLRALGDLCATVVYSFCVLCERTLRSRSLCS